MSFPSQSSIQDPSNPSSPKTSARHTRVQHSAWGPTAHTTGSRRGLTPLSTGQASAQARSGTGSPSRNLLSPTISAFNPPPQPPRQASSRHSSISSSSSLLSPLASQSQNRTRQVTSTGSPRLGSSASGTFAPQERGGVGGSGFGGSRLARQSPSLSISTTASPTGVGPQSAGPAGQLTSLVITQLNILLSTIKEDKDRSKWETQADKIWKLVDAHGMEVFSQYFRRLLQSNASHIAGGRPSEGVGGQYQLLVNEIQKLATDPDQAVKIAESLDTTDGDVFKDFDLNAFADHFRLNPLLRVSLASACKYRSRPELRTKADAMLTQQLDQFLSTISEPQDVHDHIPPAILASTIDRLVHNPPKNWSDEKKQTLQYAVHLRYKKLGASLPYAIGAALALIDLTSATSPLIRLLQQNGPRATRAQDSCKDMLSKADASAMGYHQVADALLYMAITDIGERYDLTTFVAAVRQHRSGQRLDWQDVVSAFDRQHLRVTKPQFLLLYNALVPVAREIESFDIQALWGGTWNNADTQLSFVVAFLSSSQAELDVSQIPRLRPALVLDEYNDASDEVKEHAAKAVTHPMASYEATAALFLIIFMSQEAYNAAQSLSIPEAVINANTDIFVSAASSVAKPWTPLQEQALKQLFYPFFTKSLPNYSFVMHSLWVHDKTWLAGRFIEHHGSNPKMMLPLIFDHAREHRWIETLTSVRNDFGLDFTALAHSEGEVELDKWAHGHIEGQKVPAVELSRAIIGFLKFKIDDESAAQRDGAQSTTIPLKVRTVFALLNVIQGTVTEQEEGTIQRQCIQAYPRLINYGYKFDAIIDANGEAGNTLHEDADAKMQEQYKDMYSGDADARKMINMLRTLRDSENAADQELFAAMIAGLLDEYSCFGEYPLEALATTAVLFGGIINFGILHSRITLSVALMMVVDALLNFTPDDSMYKFGLQASLHFIGRLEEWPQLCERLCKISALRGTEVFTKAEEVVEAVRRSTAAQADEAARDLGLANGNGEEFEDDNGHQSFTSINVDPPLRPGFYEEPDEETSEKVTFVLNNVSKRNLEEKFRELADCLHEQYHQWFASYLVENLAKSQPNFQGLYIQLLELFDKGVLWAEVVRETYVSVARIINSEATINSSADRTNLKNLAIWLGLLTLSRNQPILHRNISFKDLLIEAYQSQRLLVALPFTCKILAQASQSSIFQPPNPWTMELIGMLMELYHFAELKLNLKFEIEVLCKELGLDHKSQEPADIIRSIPMTNDETFMPSYGPESMDGFGEMLGLSKRANERLSAAEVMKSLPDLTTILDFPPAAGNVSQQQIKNILLTATQRAIQEIIAPVVDRSVTIAAISTTQLVEKDFAMEADADRMQQSAYNVVKALSGSLAGCTSREPLKMSIINNIRLLAAQHMPDQMAEGSILMFVNDNLDTVCKLVEDSAEKHSVAEIDAQLEQALEARRRHRQQRPHEPFNEPPVSRWAFFVPEPYRQEQGGLNQHQLAIYEDFGRHVRLPTLTHANNVSQDSSRQIPDVLNDNYLPTIPTPAETPALPRQAVAQQQRIQPPVMQNQHHGQVNGFADVPNVHERTSALLRELRHQAQEAPEDHIRDLNMESPTRDVYEQLVHTIETTPQKDQLAWLAGSNATAILFNESKDRLEIEVLVQLLNQLCLMSASTARQLCVGLQNINDERIFNAPVMTCLLKTGLLDLHHVDKQTSEAMDQRRPLVLDFFASVVDELLLSEQAGPLRADFALSLGSLTQWACADADNDKAKEVVAKFDQPARVANGVSATDPVAERREQFGYIFDEWTRLQRAEVPEIYRSAFIQQLPAKQGITSRDDIALLMRVACELSVSVYDNEVMKGGNMDVAYRHVDAFAKLIAALTAYYKDEDVLGAKKLAFLESMLCVVILLFNDFYEKMQEQFPGRFFFRFFSTLLVEVSAYSPRLGDVSASIPAVLGRALLAVQPQFFPVFAFHWITLLGHRKLVVPLMRSAMLRNDENPSPATLNSWSAYTKLLCTALAYLGELEDIIETSTAAQDMYRATLRILCIIQHDYPEFLAENHLFLNSSIKGTMIQLHNVINCANPSTLQELPDPFTPGLKINRLEQVRQNPTISAECDSILVKASIRSTVDRILGGTKDASPTDLSELIPTLMKPPTLTDILPVSAHQSLLANALMLYLGTTATIASSTFSASAPQAKLLEGLLNVAPPHLRYVLISAMANQVRFPSSHTHYFSTAMLHLFTVASDDVQQQLARVLVERLLVARPHPWGLIVTVLELIKNGRYNIFEKRWMKAAPEVERMLLGIAHAQQGAGGGGSPM